MKTYFDSLTSGIEASIREADGQASPRKQFALEISRFGQRLYSEDSVVAWCGVCTPFDLLNALGVTSCYSEFIGAMLASTGEAERFLDIAAAAGYSTDTCSYHRAVLGAAKNSLMPTPDFLIGTSSPCTGGLAVTEELARIFDRDLFVLHVPPDDSKSSVTHLARQLEELAEFVSARTGIPPDRERLREAMALTNRARAALEETFRLAMRVPSPVNSRDLRNLGIVIPLLFGTEKAVKLAESFRDELQGRIDRGESGVPGERLRLMWLQNRIQFRNPVIKILEEGYGASIVIDELNSITWDPIDPDDPFPGLARRAISIPFNCSAEHRIEHIFGLIRKYRVNGVINPCHWGCRQGTGLRGVISEALKERGIPVLNLEVDCIDRRNTAAGQIKTRLEAFLEFLESRNSQAS